MGAAAVLGALGLAYVWPALAAARGSRTGLLGLGAGVLGRYLAAEATGARSLPDAFAHPVSVLAVAYLTARSFVGRYRGTLRWKGREVR